MAEFIRPEARALLWRWREVFAALALGALGLWWSVTAFGPLQWLGWLVLVVAALLALAAVQRVRFGAVGGGEGVVHVDERRLSYFGPVTGGIIDLDLLVRLELDPTSDGASQWIFTARDGARVEIPTDAEGADQLFDVFATLPGLRTEVVLDALSRTGSVRSILWVAPRHRLH